MRTLASLLTGVALAALPATGSSIGLTDGNLEYITSVEYSSEFGEVDSGLPRVTIIDGSTMQPRDNCFQKGQTQEYTKVILNLSEGETPVDAFKDLEQLDFRKEFLQQLGRNVFDNNRSGYQDWSSLDYFRYTQGVLAEPEPIIATFYQECPKQLLPRPQYLEGRIADQQADIYGSSFTLDANFSLFEGKVLVGNRIRLITDGTVRLYSERGFLSSGNITRFDKMEVVGKSGEILFTYGPQYNRF